MNTLEQLNTYSNSQIPFVDDRSLIITTATTNTTTQSVTIVEDQPVDLSTFGVTFAELRSLDNATADNITLTFDFSAASNPAVEWPTKDAFIEGNTKYNNIVFSSPTPGVFVAEDIQLNSDYLAVLANSEIIARDQTALYSYTITVSWPGNTFTQQFDVTTTPVAETNLNGLSLTARSLFAHLLFDPTLVPTPAVTDAAIGSTYELLFTSTAGATLATTVGGTPTTSITLTGDKDAVNAALETVYYTPLNGFYQQTDTINYSLTVTNPSQGAPYVSETGSFSNYVPAFGEVTGISGRSVNTSITQDLFIAPYPVVEDSIGQILTLEITSTVGELKESQTTGSFSNTLTLTGTKSTLSTALQTIQYKPVIALGTTTDTLNYTLTWSTFTLDTGSWLHETTIDTLLLHLNSTGDTVTDIVSDDLFPVTYNGGTLPSITSTDTNNLYQLTLNYNSSKSEINGSSTGTETFTGTASAVGTALLSATYRPLTQDTTDTISYTFSLSGVTIQTGTFSKTLQTYFEVIDVPSSITLQDQNDAVLFSTPLIPTIVDYTSGYNNVSFNMASPGTFNSTSSTVSYSGYAEPTGGDPDINTLISATTYDPNNPLTPTTEIITYDLTAQGVTWISGGSIDVEVPAQIEIFNFDNRSYTGNTVNNNIFLPAGDSPYLEDNLDPNRTLQLEILASAGSKVKGPGSALPYGQSVVITGTAAAINSAIASTINPIGLIPALNSNGVTLTFTVVFSAATLTTQTMSFAKTSDATLATTIHTNNFTLTEDQYFYGALDTVMVGAGGGAGKGVGNTNIADSGAGGDGAIVKFEDYLLDNLSNSQLNFVFSTGTGGLHGSNAGDNGTVGGNTVLGVGSSPGVASTSLYTAYGGGGGGGAFSYGTTSAGGPGYARSVVAVNGPGGNGGAAIWVNDDDPQNPYNEQALATGAVAGVGYATTTGQTPTRLSVLDGADGRIDSGFPRGGNSTEPTFFDNITGTTQEYSALGGYQDSEVLENHDGEDGEIVVRIKAR